MRLEPGTEVVRDRLKSGQCVMHAVNVAEFCFTISRKLPEAYTPDTAMAWIATAEIGVAENLDPDFLRLTAHIRLASRESRALSVGDGIAVALAASLGVPLLTTERAFNHAADFARIELIR